jgi:hypothetical protein
MAKVAFMFQIDIGFSSEKGYAAVVKDVIDKKSKGIKANSIRQLMRRVSDAVATEEQRKRRFPLESEAPVILTPGNGF